MADDCCTNKALSAANPHALDCINAVGFPPPMNLGDVEGHDPADESCTCERDESNPCPAHDGVGPNGEHQPDAFRTDNHMDSYGDEVYLRELLEALAGELGDDYVKVEQAARALANERHSKTTEAELWYADMVGYLRGVLALITGEDVPLHVRADDRPVPEQAIALISQISINGSPDVARDVAAQAATVPHHWSGARVYLRGAAEALATLSKHQRRFQEQELRDFMEDGVEERMKQLTDDASWFEGFGRAVFKWLGPVDRTNQPWKALVIGVTQALGHEPTGE